MTSSECCPLSEDLIYDILIRLPVKLLLRFKAVSKLWRCIISSPGFVKSHQARQESHAEATLIIHHEETNDDLHLPLFSLFQLGPVQLVADLKCPWFTDSLLVGSDRGIVCVTVKQDWFSICQARCHTSTYLWNPATMQYKLIPPHPLFYDYHSDVKVDLGFGFDPIDNDFKVVRFLSSQCASQVYSANMNMWRKVVPEVKDINYTGYDKVCVDGVLCWADFDCIFSFDLNKEVFSSVKYISPIKDCFPCITDFNNSIAVIIGKEINGKINLWTLEDIECLRGGGVGVAASWTPMLSIDANVPGNSVLTHFYSGDLILISDDGKWFSYDYGKKETKEIPVSISWNCNSIFKYTETLVSITGFKQVKWNAHEDDM